MGLIAILQAPDDLHGVLYRRLAHQHRLKTPLKGGVFLYVLAVLINRRRPDDAELPAGEGGLEHVRGVHRTLGGAGPDRPSPSLAEVLEAAPIGGQPFAQDISRRDCTAFLLLFDTYDTRLLAQALRRENGHYRIGLYEGGEITARSLIVATGARYRRLDVPGLERFEGVSVHYAATEAEVQRFEGEEVVVVGGENSAGQAAVYLAGRTRRVRSEE